MSRVRLHGEIPEGTEVDDEAISGLKVTSVKYQGIGDLTADLQEQ